MPYIVEAVTMVDEGIAPEVIDKAATDYGMPMGPIELADTVGLDICQSVANILSQALSMTCPANLNELSDKKLGKKTQLWLGAWWIPRGKEEEVYEGGKKLAALECDQFYTWSFRAGKGTNETSEDPDKTWAVIERLYRELSGK